MANRNLLTETLTELSKNNKTENDVKFVQGNNYTITFAQFKKAAEKINYDNGYGIVEIDSTLKIVGKDWWLERYTYDGAEKFVFKTMPKNEHHSDVMFSLLEKYNVN